MMISTEKDTDPLETKDWIKSVESVVRLNGIDRAKFIVNKIFNRLKKYDPSVNIRIFLENYINSIDHENEPCYPGNLKIERNIRNAIRWNAIMIVLRASKKNLDLGGHISSFQSLATIYEVCFNHFFQGEKHNGGDVIYFQGHSSPGIYARAFIEGRITENQMNNFRQEINGNGLPSYPHPKSMPNFWQFPTVSMGLGPIMAIYQAKFLKYLKNRKLKDTSNRTVYAFIGDGEMDEPESKGAINIAAREKLDNLIFIINCNLQRLDGPVTGNSKIIEELSSIFIGSGWTVIKVIWGDKWDKLFSKDHSGKLTQLVNETVDGDYQNLRSKDGAYIRKNFFNKYSETAELVKNLSDDEIWNLNRGGHDPKKIYAAIKHAKNVKNKPVVILAHTIKGYGIGDAAESKNIAHQIKKLNINSLRYIKNRLNISVSDEKLHKLPYITFNKNSEEYNYLHNRRKILGGYVPIRQNKQTKITNIPKLEEFQFILTEQKKLISTTTAFVRILKFLLRYQSTKDILIPILADEARTFGMEGLFREIGIYNPNGQQYTPQDIDQIAYYKEDKSGQIIQEGINESGAAALWLAAATSYSTNNFPTIPIYIYYSMFGFQRIGDLLWAAGDQQAKGFLIGGTSGRTTLNGEGLQHEDGHSHIQSLVIPNCVSYDPAYAYELAVILQNGLTRMYGNKPENIFYYITITNENYKMPSMPENITAGICKGIYLLKTKTSSTNIKNIQLLSSGAILRHALTASEILFEQYKINTYVYSVTSFTELARNGQICERWNMLNPRKKQRIPYACKIMHNYPTVAVTDYMKLFAEQIRNYIPTKSYLVLGTDGFGISDSRENLRNYFEISTNYIVLAALYILFKSGKINDEIINSAIADLKLDTNKINPCLR